MVTHYRCATERRLQAARTQRGVDGKYLNGIDYLEVSSDQKTLTIHLLQDLSTSQPLTEGNVRITDAQGAPVAIDSVTGAEQLLTVRLKGVSPPAPFYQLQLVRSPVQLAQSGIVGTVAPPPPQNFDSQLAHIRFSLQGEDGLEIDCKGAEPLPDSIVPPPVIDYLAKDYASFRQLMLDRLTVTMPAWKERSPADIGVMLVEILAYAADQLSYYQDAAATEAYLGTARRRMSVRRHARLLDYFMHDGCNARTWVVIEVQEYNLKLVKLDSPDGLPSTGNSLVIAAKIGKFYHIRIFDRTGKLVLDKGNDEFLPDGILRQQLEAEIENDGQTIFSQRTSRLIDKIISSLVHTQVQHSQTAAPIFDPKLDGIPLLGPSTEDNRPGTQFFTRMSDFPTVLDPRKPQQQELIAKAVNRDIEVFESMSGVTLYEPCNTIYLYTWGEENCSLSLGATQATLKDTGGRLRQCLKKGMVLIFEEYRNVDTGEKHQGDLTHRHAVRLTRVTPQEDSLLPETDNPTQKQRLLEIEWHLEDALPFLLVISKRVQGKLYEDISICRGNVLLVDHGRTRPDNGFLSSTSLENDKNNANRDAKHLEENRLNLIPDVDRYRPRLNYGPLTHQRYIFNTQGEWKLVCDDQPAQQILGWYTPELSKSPFSIDGKIPSKYTSPESKYSTKEYKDEELARESLDQKRYFIKPSITLKEYNTQAFVWSYQQDLLNSGPFDRSFVVETEEDGRAYLRFGDDDLGKCPDAGNYFEVTYRTGNGTAGNVGAEAIAHIVTEHSGIKSVRNPLPAQGGIDPESLDQVRLYAPQAFRVPQRAVTEADYASIAERYPDIQRVKATRRWTGSWYTIFLTVDRKGDRLLDYEFKQGLRTFMERFHMAGEDLEIEAPRFVPLKITMKVQVKPGYFQGAVKQALLETFSTRVLPNGLLGFFHPDRLTFGQSIYLSQVIQAAVQVEGVQSIEVKEFQRWNQPPQGELSAGQMTFGPLEIPQLNNEPANPGKGRIEFEMEGGQ